MVGLYLGLNFREQLQGKYGEPLVSELDQLVASIQAHLQDVVEARESRLSPNETCTVLHTNITKMGLAANTDEQTAWEYVMPQDTLTHDKMGLLISAYGSTAGNSNGKTIRFYWDNLQKLTTGVQSWNGEGWQFHALIHRTGADRQKGFAVFRPESLTTLAHPGAVFNATSTLKERVPLRISIQSQVGAADNVVFEGISILKLGLPSS